MNRDHSVDGRRASRRRIVLAPLAALVLVANGLLLAGPLTGNASSALADVCGKRYVAGGDHIPAGHEVSDSERYPEKLVETHLDDYGFCVFNVAKNETSSATYISQGQLAQTRNLWPDFITLTVGEENPTIINLVNSCFDKLKDHDFTDANVCAAQILANSTLWSGLTSNLTTTLQAYRITMAGRPQLVVAVTGYPNPYPDSLEATAKIALLCVPLIDTIPTCTIRWAQLPPALLTLDQVFQKLNTTIQNSLKPFQAGPSGNRFVFVDTYTKTRSHCMKMEVTIKTTVEHPEESGAPHEHDSPAINFGCSDPWYVAGSDGTKIPEYLAPAAIGVLVNKSQTTVGMGIHPNADGHECIANLIWEADTIDPGTTPLKWKLGAPEAANPDICE
jgi:hypothetical protein